MDITALIQAITVMTVIVIIGMIIARNTGVNDEGRKLITTIIINVAMPCLILNGIFRTPIDHRLLVEIVLTFVIAAVASLFGLVMGWIAAKICLLPKVKAAETAIVAGLGNTGFIGIPLCATLFGSKGALLAAVFDAGMDFTMWTAGIMLLQRSVNTSSASLRLLINLPFVAIVGGLSVAILGIKPPEILVSLTDTLAKAAPPLGMLYVGFLIPSLIQERKAVPVYRVGVPVAIKLFIYPLSVALLIALLPLSEDIAKVVLLQTAMPTIAIAPILFARFSADEGMGALATVFSTLLSFGTIPLVFIIGNLIF